MEKAIIINSLNSSKFGENDKLSLFNGFFSQDINKWTRSIYSMLFSFLSRFQPIVITSSNENYTSLKTLLNLVESLFFPPS